MVLLYYNITVEEVVTMGIRNRRKQRPRTRYVSRLTSKYQATIPKEIREHLHIESGDQIIYELLPDLTVVIRRTYPIDLEYLDSLKGTLSEWESDSDEQAYKNL
jgi:AbrB family looped-hinge helix DNA binding protein